MHQLKTKLLVASNYREALTLMRIPFSVFLMPVFWFALSTVANYSAWRAVSVFIILHLLVYPASNGYNSYYDRDEESIGGLKHPPKVTQELMYLVVLFDALSVALAVWLSPLFGALVSLYLLISKAYSYEGIRLKKYPVISTIVVTFFQGAFTYLLVQIGAGISLAQVLQLPNLLFALVSTLFLCGSYPLTQIYQHEEDRKRGDNTLSLILGVRGTFIFAALGLLLGAFLLLWLYMTAHQFRNLFILLLCTAPILFFFTRWIINASHDIRAVNYENTMQMNKISSICISLAFVLMMASR